MGDHSKSCTDSIFGMCTPAPLISDMFCICGYSSNDGNVLAKHLAICDRKSAYPSLEEAKKAISPHSMLDSLGLIRRPEEATANKDDKPEETSTSATETAREGEPPVTTEPITEDTTVKEEQDIVIEPTEVSEALSVQTNDVMEILDDDVTAKLEEAVSKELKEKRVAEPVGDETSQVLDDITMDIDM